MVTRQALLISAPDVAVPALEGARKDPYTIARFLMEPYGGAWRSSEIRMLENPSRNEVLEQVRELADYEYTIVSFSGHGEHPPGQSYPSESEIELRGGTKATANELKPENSKHVVVLDSCRVVERLIREGLGLSGIEKRGALITPNAARCRDRYDAEIAASSDDSVVLYACRINEKAGEYSETGGIFTLALVNETRQVLQESPGSPLVISVADAFGLAASRTTQLRRLQHPTYEWARSDNGFPWGVLVR